MNDLINKIIEMEIEYVKLFSNVVEDDTTITFSDPLILDMYSHNFIYYKNKEGLFDFLVKQLSNENIKSKGFFKVETTIPINEDFINKLPIKPEITVYDFYHSKTDRYEEIKYNSNCNILKADNDKILTDGINVDIQANINGMGLDFATRRINRKTLEYKNTNKLIDFYVCFYNDKPIGKIEYAYKSDIVKLEDFDIIEEYQRKGVGSSALRHLLKEAYENNIKDAYLVAIKSESAKEMYLKCGFTKVGEKTELLFFFNK